MLLSLYKLFVFSFFFSFLFRCPPAQRNGRRGVAVRAKKMPRRIIFFSSGKEGQILVYLEFILGSLSFSDAQVLYASAIFDLLSSCHSLPLSDIFLSFSLSLPPSSFLCFHLLSYCLSFLSFILHSWSYVDLT